MTPQPSRRICCATTARILNKIIPATACGRRSLATALIAASAPLFYAGIKAGEAKAKRWENGEQGAGNAYGFLELACVFGVGTAWIGAALLCASPNRPSSPLESVTVEQPPVPPVAITTAPTRRR